MTVDIHKFILGPLENNTYVVAEKNNDLCIVIDPAAPSEDLLHFINSKMYKIKYFLITHAHFDHIAGIHWFESQLSYHVPIAIHPEDLPVWRIGGGSKEFGFEFDPGTEPEILLEDNQNLLIGQINLKVFHTPGHSPGHVVFYEPTNNAVFCGDLIFRHGVGRTDLVMSDSKALLESIRSRIFVLDPETRLLPGHGPETTVGEEIRNNPFLKTSGA